MFISLPPISQPKNKKPATLCCAGGPKGALFSGLLCTPRRARHVAVMVLMRPGCVRGFHWEIQK
jgi:hypothetical protein